MVRPRRCDSLNTSGVAEVDCLIGEVVGQVESGGQKLRLGFASCVAAIFQRAQCTRHDRPTPGPSLPKSLDC
jgi:hypothetical protein